MIPQVPSTIQISVPARPIGPNAPLPTVDDKLTTMFVAQISEGVDDEWMEKILSTCGPIRSWKRMTDAQGKPKAFGFCVYELSRSVLLALKVLGGEGDFPSVYGRQKGVGVELPSMVSGGQSKCLKVNTDESARKHSMEEAELADDDVNEDLRVLENVNAIIAEMRTQKLELDPHRERSMTPQAPSFSETLYNVNTAPLADGTLNELKDLENDHRQYLSGEISNFREIQAQKEKERRELEEQELENRRRWQENERQREREIDRQREVKERDSARNKSGGNYSSKRRREDDEWNSDDEQKRAERREQEMEQAFIEREKRWEIREQTRLKSIEADKLRDQQDKERLANFELLEKKFREFDDDFPGSGDEDFLQDRPRWWGKREPFRVREAEQDEKDRIAELKEQERNLRPPEPSAEDRAMIDSLMKEAGPQKEDAVAESSAVVVGRIMTADEQDRALRSLVSMLPADREGLWGWRVRWDFLDENALVSILRPFIGKKVAEYLGDEDEDLVNFILDLVRNRHGAQYVFEELQQALDEEAEIFVLKLWRKVIFETEARARGLN